VIFVVFDVHALDSKKEQDNEGVSRIGGSDGRLGDGVALRPGGVQLVVFGGRQWRCMHVHGSIRVQPAARRRRVLDRDHDRKLMSDEQRARMLHDHG
jgi:hypothetical protein